MLISRTIVWAGCHVVLATHTLNAMAKDGSGLALQLVSGFSASHASHGTWRAPHRLRELASGGSRWTAGAERRAELRAFHVLPPDPPAGETPGLARQIFERQLEGLEPAGDALGVDEPSGGGAGAAAGGDDGHTSVLPGIRPKKRMRGGYFKYFTRG